MTKFNKGDKVKVSDRSIPSDYKIKYGETHTVDSVSADRVFLKGITGFYYESRFDLVATGWFNPGDKVKVVDAERTRYSKDEIVTVIEQTSNDNVRVMGANETVAVATALGGYYPWRFQLVDSLASTIAAVKKGDRVTVRTMLAPYAEFEVVVANLTYIGSANSEVLIRKVDIIELTITKPALPAEPGVGAIVKFTEAHHNSAYQIRDENGWIPIRDNGFVSPTHYTWERTLVDVGPEFEVIREGGK